MVATTGAHFAEPSRGRLAAAMAAIRARQSLESAAGWLARGGNLRSGQRRWPGCSTGIRTPSPRLPTWGTSVRSSWR